MLGYSLKVKKNMKANNNVFYQKIYNQVHKKNRNCLIVVTGDTGKGKSYIAMKIAHMLDPEGFNHKTLRQRLIADPKQFTDLVVNKKDQLYTGATIVFDEAGTGLAAREWYSHNNRAIDYILQTFRYQKLIVIFTVPNMNFIDIHARKLFHFYVEALDINIGKKLNKCKVFELSYNKMKPDDPYRKYLRKDRNKIKFFRLKKVPVKLWHEYEKYAEEFKEIIGHQAIEKAKPKVSKTEVFNPEEIANKILDNQGRYMKMWRGRRIVDRNKVEIDFKIGMTKSLRVKSLVEDKLREGNVKVKSEDDIFT